MYLKQYLKKPTMYVVSLSLFAAQILPLSNLLVQRVSADTSSKLLPTKVVSDSSNNWSAEPNNNNSGRVEAVSSNDNDSSYIVTTNSGKNQVFKLDNYTVPTDSEINSVTLNAVAKKTSSDPTALRMTAAEIVSESYDLTEEYTSYSWTLTENPITSSAWLTTDISNWEVNFGLQKASESGTVRVTEFYGTIDYTQISTPVENLTEDEQPNEVEEEPELPAEQESEEEVKTASIDTLNQNNLQIDYCDPSQYNIVTNKDNISPEQRAECFTVEPVQSCGYFNVSVTGPVYPAGTYRAQWIYDGETRDARRNFPAVFNEDYNNGSVTVRYLLVGPESDFLTGTGIPNYWDNLLSDPYTINTDCEKPEQPVEPSDPCDPFIKQSVLTYLTANNLNSLANNTGSIAGCKFNDKDSNGQWNGGEETLPGFEFQLYTCQNSVNDIEGGVCEGATLTDTAITNNNGVYRFDSLANGTYMVCESQTDGWIQTYPTNDNGDAVCWLVPINGDDCVVNFGNKKEEGEVLGEKTPPQQVLAETGSPLLQGLIISMSILGVASSVTYFNKQKQY